jgi:hypothetical protein
MILFSKYLKLLRYYVKFAELKLIFASNTGIF